MKVAVIATHFYFLNFLKNFKLFKSVCKSNTVYNLTISSYGWKSKIGEINDEIRTFKS